MFGLDYDRRLVKVTKAMMLIAGDGKTNTFKVNTLDHREWSNRELRFCGHRPNFDSDGHRIGQRVPAGSCESQRAGGSGPPLLHCLCEAAATRSKCRRGVPETHPRRGKPD